MATKTVNLNIKTKGAKEAEKSFKNLGTSISGVSSIMQGVMASALIVGAAKLSRTAAEAEGVRIAFDRLNKPDLLNNLRTATKGTVSDLELMKRAVSANNFRISLEQLPTLLKFAQQRARETGESVDYLVNSIVTGIGRKSPLILDNLGLSALEVREEFKKTGDMAKAVGNIINREFAKSGEPINTLADDFDRTSASIQNMGVAFGEMINTIGKESGIFQGLTDGFKELSNVVLLLGDRNIETVGDRIEVLKSKIAESPDSMFMNSAKAELKALEQELRVLKNAADDGLGRYGDLVKKNIGETTPVISEAETAYREFALAQDAARVKAQQTAEFEARYNEELMRRAGLMTEIGIVTDVTIEQNERLKDSIEGVQVAANDMGDDYINNVAREIESRNMNLLNSFSGTLSQAMMHSGNTFKNIGNAFKEMLINMAAQIAARAAIFSLFNLFTGGNFGLGVGGIKSILPFAKGGDFVTNGPQLIMVGDNPGGRERVQITPTSSPNVNGPQGSVVINFNGSITNEQMVEDFIIPKINESIRRTG